MYRHDDSTHEQGLVLVMILSDVSRCCFGKTQKNLSAPYQRLRCSISKYWDTRKCRKGFVLSLVLVHLVRKPSNSMQVG